jgi:HlyD family secretion protein
MLEVDKDRVALPLEDPGKLKASAPSSHAREGGSSWRRLLLAGLLFGLSMIASIYFQPLAVRILELNSP